MISFVNFWVDDVYTVAPRTFTILQACSSAGVEVPRFCYHEKLSIAGNCRMCLVEVNNSKKLVASCAVPVSENLKVYTNNLRVKKARESVLEFLLANHPLDCPICDQGGECDLQDITISFGADRGRFYEIEKRAVEDKYCGPLIKTVMTRCIHCTRCIRFISEVSGHPDLGTTGRGSRMEVGTFTTNALMNELSSNIIDLCPVGALTSKPYSFTSRPWELSSVESIDIFDVLCSNIRISVYGNKVKRILPRINEHLNEDWLPNKTRYVYDSFDIQRLSYPMLNVGRLVFKNLNLWVSVSWKQVLLICVSFLNKIKLDFILGPHLDLETIFELKQTFSNLGLFNLHSPFNDFSSSYFSSVRVKEIEVFSNFFSFNVYLRNEVPLLNTRVRKSYNYFMSSFKFYGVGVGSDYFTYPIKNVANNINSLVFFLLGKNYFCRKLISHKNTFAVFYSRNFSNILNPSFIGLFNPALINVSQSVSNIGSSHYGFDVNNSYFTKSKFFYSIGLDLNANLTPIIYQGHHGENSTKNSVIIMPTALFVEKSSTYLNLEGLVQKANCAVSSGKFIKKDWEIFKAIFDFSGVLGQFFFNSKSTFGTKNFSSSTTDLKKFWFQKFVYSSFNSSFLFFKNYLFSMRILNYYWNDLISQNSKIMAKCASIIINYNISYK